MRLRWGWPLRVNIINRRPVSYRDVTHRSLASPPASTRRTRAPDLEGSEFSIIDYRLAISIRMRLSLPRTCRPGAASSSGGSSRHSGSGLAARYCDWRRVRTWRTQRVELRGSQSGPIGPIPVDEHLPLVRAAGRELGIPRERLGDLRQGRRMRFSGCREGRGADELGVMPLLTWCGGGRALGVNSVS